MCSPWEMWLTVCFFSLLLRMVRPRLTIYVCQESLQLREQQQQQQNQQKHEDGDSNGTFFGRSFWTGQDRCEEKWRDDSRACVMGIYQAAESGFANSNGNCSNVYWVPNIHQALFLAFLQLVSPHCNRFYCSSPTFRWGKWGLGMLSNLPQVAQLAGDWAGISIQAVCFCVL